MSPAEMQRAHVLGVKLFKHLFTANSVDILCKKWFKYTRKGKCIFNHFFVPFLNAFFVTRGFSPPRTKQSRLRTLLRRKTFSGGAKVLCSGDYNLAHTAKSFCPHSAGFKKS